MQSERPKDKKWTIPNAISVARFFMGLVVASVAIISWMPLEILVPLYAFAIFTDKADGFIARRFHQQSTLGEQLLEPLADATLIFAGLLYILLREPVYIWFQGVILVVIVVLIASQIVYRQRSGRFMRPMLIRKWPVAVAYLTILFWIWQHPNRYLLTYIAVFAGAWVLWEVWMRVLGKEPWPWGQPYMPKKEQDIEHNDA